ncbi:hypothetical protein NUW58_g899 [Xylaria curta]|uniref:Uncharacterized protein n=1 Tax=Xylaria curta TaxID=42375 RepID=A0ACC1PNN4_9PEZI|nr:hypothetical protein NUW58_g899 [Xylaria curta]
MDNITKPELALLSKQRSTTGPDGSFDASQFELLVGQNVSSDVVGQLQHKFGDDMAGGNEIAADFHLESIAIDSFLDQQKQSPKPPAPGTDGHQDASETGGQGGVDNPDPLGRRDFLAPKFMYWALPELEMLAKHYRSVKNNVATFEFNAALKFIESEFGEMISELTSLVPHSITFKHLWALLPPDCLVVGKDALDFDSIWCVREHSVQKTQEGIFLLMDAERVVWDGSKAGNVRETLAIPIFNGIKQIQDLSYIPLKYHPQREAVMQCVLERSAKALTFWHPEFRHQEHHGIGLAQVDKEVEFYTFSGRVIIDPKMMRQVQPASKVMPSTRNISNLRKTSRICFSDLTTDEQEPEILARLLTDATRTGVENTDEPVTLNGWRNNKRFEIRQWIESNSDDDDNSYTPSSPASAPQLKSSAADTVQLSREQMLLVSGLLYGYSLQEGKWGAFAVDRVAPIAWNSTIFESLVMEKTLKDIIYRIVVAHGLEVSNFDDFVKGKGKGFIGLLFGPPGSGKTLTAEAIAETAKMPLYAVSSGALGHDAELIHENLSKILKLASHWKAVLLLDEADVFLAQRAVADIARNAIVSVFLRELEYYQGILLLTTNQAEAIDTAFQSRIHLSLEYPGLDAVARFKIWSNFMANARKSTGIKADIDEDGLRHLAEMPLNGRQIKNTVSIAVKIATTSDSRTITTDTLRDTVRLLQNVQISEYASTKTLDQDGSTSRR